MTIRQPAAIEPVRRTFAVLEALNRRRTSSLAQLVSETGLPKPTLVRLLETLIALGYAARVSRALGYRVTDRVLGLSGGVRFVDHLVDAAAPRMRDFTRDHGWPLYLGTVGGGAITIRHSTAPDSPLSFETTGYQRRSPPLQGAIGRAYLAFCPAAERLSVLREIEAASGMRMEPAEWTILDSMFERIRREGYAFQASRRPMRVHGVAVPVLLDGQPLGAISLRYPKSAMSEAEAATRYVASLTSLAAGVAADVALSRSPPG